MFITIDKMTEKQAKKILKEIIEKLDNLDGDDYFGSEGWRHFMGFDG